MTKENVLLWLTGFRTRMGGGGKFDFLGGSDFLRFVAIRRRRRGFSRVRLISGADNY